MSTPSTGRSSASPTDRALPLACRAHRLRDHGRRPASPRSVARPPRTGCPSCSRIARRWGEVEASERGGGCIGAEAERGHARLRARQISSAGHLRGPLRRDEVVVPVILRVLRRLQLDEIARPRSRSPAARGSSRRSEVELDAAVAQLEAVHAEVRPQEPVPAGCPSSGEQRMSERRVDEEDELAARPQQPRRLGIQRYGSHQIEAPYSEIARSKDSSGSGTVLGARLDERELEPVLALDAPRRLELRRRSRRRRPGARRAARATPRSMRCRTRARRRPCPPPRAAREPRPPGPSSMPHAISSRSQARARRWPTYSALPWSRRSRFRAACSVSVTACAPSRSPPSASAAPRRVSAASR